MGQIGSTMVSVCATSWANWQRISAVSDNMIIINYVIWPKERTVQCQRNWTNGVPYELIKIQKHWLLQMYFYTRINNSTGVCKMVHNCPLVLELHVHIIVKYLLFRYIYTILFRSHCIILYINMLWITVEWYYISKYVTIYTCSSNTNGQL